MAKKYDVSFMKDLNEPSFMALLEHYLKFCDIDFSNIIIELPESQTTKSLSELIELVCNPYHRLMMADGNIVLIDEARRKLKEALFSIRDKIRIELKDDLEMTFRRFIVLNDQRELNNEMKMEIIINDYERLKKKEKIFDEYLTQSIKSKLNKEKEQEIHGNGIRPPPVPAIKEKLGQETEGEQEQELEEEEWK